MRSFDALSTVIRPAATSVSTATEGRQAASPEKSSAVVDADITKRPGRFGHVSRDVS